MARITRWSPFHEMVDMQRRMDRLFEEVAGNFESNRQAIGWR
jgi:hypothetical protein